MIRIAKLVNVRPVGGGVSAAAISGLPIIKGLRDG